MFQKPKTCGHVPQVERRLHHAAHHVLRTTGARLLFVPRILSFEQYVMDKISVEQPVYYPRGRLALEIAIFWNEMARLGIFAWDFELYHQQDGRVAMIDFNKFGLRGKMGWEFPVNVGRWTAVDLLRGVFMPRNIFFRKKFINLKIIRGRTIPRANKCIPLFTMSLLS